MTFGLGNRCSIQLSYGTVHCCDMSQTECRLAMLAGHGPYQPLLRAPGDCLRGAVRKILPATASSISEALDRALPAP